MEKGVNSNVNISYSIDCPYCGETSYSDTSCEDWNKLEWGDGYPHGEITCDECYELFEVEIS